MDFVCVMKLNRTMPGCGEFSLLLFIGTLHDFKGFRLVSISVSSCDLGVELYTQDLIKFLGHRLFQDIFFKIITSDGGRSFIHYFVERVEILRMFIHSDRVKVLYCFGMKLTGTWKHVPPS